MGKKKKGVGAPPPPPSEVLIGCRRRENTTASNVARTAVLFCSAEWVSLHDAGVWQTLDALLVLDAYASQLSWCRLQKGGRRAHYCSFHPGNVSPAQLKGTAADLVASIEANELLVSLL